MKKYVSLILSMLLILGSLAGCSPKTTEADTATTPEATNGSESTLSGEITFSTWGSLEERKVNEEIIALFEEKNPGTKVNLEYIPEEYTTKIDSMFLGNMAPDVIYGHPKYFVNWASQGLLMDLTDRFNETPELLNAEKFNVGLYDAFKYEGKHIATINGADTLLIHYNKTLFDAAGVPTPTEDWTYEDLINAAKALTIFGEDGKPKQFGISIGSGYHNAEAFIYANGGQLFDDPNYPKEVMVNSQETAEALQLMQDLIYVHKAAPTAADAEVLGGGFDTGKIAMIIDGVWSVVYRKDIKDFEWGFASVPAKDGAAKKIPALYAGYAIAKTTKNPDLAWEFAKFMQSDEAQKMLAGSGLITVINKDIATSDEIINIEGAPIDHILRVTTLEKSIHNDAMLPNWDEYLTKGFSPVMDQLLNNQISGDEAAAMLQTEFETLLNAN
ncbi:MAG: sugar ABC transporter substrate-binding protein [Clostridia bacterium]|nr:sugar ABC transporter substrate-binding protein [Clostridia bacterium]